LQVDLVILSEAYAGYRHSLLDSVIGLINVGPEAKALDQPAGIFVRNVAQVPEEDALLFQAVSRIVLSDRAGTLSEQLDRQVLSEWESLPFKPTRKHTPAALYLHPASLFAARFFGDATELPVVRSAQALETPFGRVASADGDDVCVCVRPADVQVGHATGAHPARVISTAFREGWHDVVIEVEWQGPTVRLLLHLRGGRAPSPGEILPVHVDPARLLVTRADVSSSRTH
jgi:hypothetical protein